MKIGFHVTGGDEWQAGISHLAVFLRALRENYAGRIQISLLAPRDKSRALEDLRPIADEVVSFSAFRKWTVARSVDWLLSRAFSRDWSGDRILRRHKIDAVFGLCMQYRYRDIPTLSWVYDFQHVHMPEMFSLQERRKRDWMFFQTARLSSRILVMSQAVKNDFESMFPQYAHKARVLRTATYIAPSLYETEPKTIAAMYQLPEKFIYLPNQFWKHKNHEVVFQAIKSLRDRGTRVFLVCSGYQGDDRHPGHFSDLLNKVSAWKIADQIRFLGLVPHAHVFQLMRGSLCVLNASLFEGFGLSVDEARSIGKHLLLSDIPAHREQDAPECLFFDPRNSEELADKLGRIWHQASPGPHLELELAARRSLPQRIAGCADSLMMVLQEVAGLRFDSQPPWRHKAQSPSALVKTEPQ